MCDIYSPYIYVYIYIYVCVCVCVCAFHNVENMVGPKPDGPPQVLAFRSGRALAAFLGHPAERLQAFGDWAAEPGALNHPRLVGKPPENPRKTMGKP